MNGNEDVAWLSIRLRERDSARLTATLAEIVKRAHAYGLRAATIFHAAGEGAIPRLSAPTVPAASTAPTASTVPPQARKGARSISLPEGVGGTVTVADEADRLRSFVAVLGDLVPADATIRLDVAHDVYDLSRQPVDR
jgi:hypothetical protein